MKPRLLSACLALSLASSFFASSLLFSGCREAEQPARTGLQRSGTTSSATSARPSTTAAVTDGATRRLAETRDAAPASTAGSSLPLEHSHSGKPNHLSRARELRAAGEREGAFLELRRELFDAPASEEAWSQTAELATTLKRRPLAAEAYERLGALRPDDAAPLVKQARVLISLGLFERAISVATEAMLREPENAKTYQALGRAHLGNGDLSAAIAMFQKVLALSPDNGHALNNLGYAYLLANENERAVAVLTRAVERLPSVAYVHNNLGVALERTGRRDEAELAYALATSLSPKYVKARINAERVAKAAANAMSEGTPEDGTFEPDGQVESDVQPEPAETVDLVEPSQE